MEEELESNSSDQEEQTRLSVHSGTIPTVYPESVLFESSRHRFHWSTELPTDARKNIRKNTIYQLMLDTRVELKNGGNKISSTRPLHSASKKRKKQLSGSLTENGLPDMVNRSPLVTAFELAINSFQVHKLQAYFDTNAAENIAFQVDMSALSPIPSMMIYREIKGIPAIVSYLNAYNQVIPDAVQLFWQKTTRKTDQGKEIETDCRMIGTKFYDIAVIEDMNVQAEQQILEAAIFGLTALAQSTPKAASKETSVSSTEPRNLRESLDREAESISLLDETHPITSMTATSSSTASASPVPSMTTTTNSNTFRATKTTSSDSNNSSFSQHLEVQDHQLLSSKKHIRSLDSITILMANEKTEFSPGKRLEKPQHIDTSGKVIWYLNPQKKITRIKFIMSKRTAVPPPVVKQIPPFSPQQQPPPSASFP